MHQELWAKLVTEMVELENVEVLRSARPEGAVGQPWVIGFWDGSYMAYQGKIYLRCLFVDFFLLIFFEIIRAGLSKLMQMKFRLNAACSLVIVELYQQRVYHHHHHQNHMLSRK